jgi:hypothetical protein
MLLGSTVKLTENRLVNHRLIAFPANDDRMSVLYYLKLTQYRIHAEAYRYYENLQKNTEQTGDIFGPIPTEIKGNVLCSSQPEEVVIGYIEACIPVKQEQFMESIRDAYEPPLKFCAMMTSLQEGGFLVYYKPYPPDPNPTIYAPASCVDCRQRGSKNKPAFWPNNHL